MVLARGLTGIMREGLRQRCEPGLRSGLGLGWHGQAADVMPGVDDLRIHLGANQDGQS